MAPTCEERETFGRLRSSSLPGPHCICTLLHTTLGECSTRSQNSEAAFNHRSASSRTRRSQKSRPRRASSGAQELLPQLQHPLWRHRQQQWSNNMQSSLRRARLSSSTFSRKPSVSFSVNRHTKIQYSPDLRHSHTR
jgi:hypothetical protein